MYITNNNSVTEDQIKSGYLNLSAIPTGYVSVECPSPFLKDPLAVQGSNATIDKDYCQFGCCIPCPAQNYVRCINNKYLNTNMYFLYI